MSWQDLLHIYLPCHHVAAAEGLLLSTGSVQLWVLTPQLKHHPSTVLKPHCILSEEATFQD